MFRESAPRLLAPVVTVLGAAALGYIIGQRQAAQTMQAEETLRFHILRTRADIAQADHNAHY